VPYFILRNIMFVFYHCTSLSRFVNIQGIRPHQIVKKVFFANSLSEGGSGTYSRIFSPSSISKRNVMDV